MAISWKSYVPTQVGVTGEATADWANAIRDRALQVFANGFSLGAAIPSPQVGQIAVMTDLTSGPLQFVGSTQQWQKLWNLPWGYVNRAVSTTDHTSITSEQDIDLSVTWTAVANRRYKITVDLPRVQQVSNLAEMQAFITKADNSHLAGGTWCKLMTVNDVASIHICAIETGISTGSVTRHLRASSAAANGKIYGATNPGYITVEDIGPSADPT